jgi:hypothetical protein
MLRFDQMPAQSLARRIYPMTLKQSEITDCKLVVPCGMDKIQTFSVVQPVSRAFESPKKEAVKCAHFASFVPSLEHLKRAEAGLQIEARSDCFDQNENPLASICDT